VAIQGRALKVTGGSSGNVDSAEVTFQEATSGVVTIEMDVLLSDQGKEVDRIIAILADPYNPETQDTSYWHPIVSFVAYGTTYPSSPSYQNKVCFVVYNDNGSTKIYDTGITSDNIAGNEIHLKIEIDLTNHVINAWVDDTQYLNSAPFSGAYNADDVYEVEAIQVSLGTSGQTIQTELLLDNIEITQDGTTIYSENFEDGTAEGWETYRSATIEVVETTSSPPFTLPAGQEVSITVTAYDGSQVTQHVHPTILHFINKINGYYYIVGLTPYPNGNDVYENPSIVFTDDLINYTEDGVSNPLVQPPENGHNADPDLVYDPNNNRILLFYTSRDKSTNDIWLHILSSTDGVNWQSVADIDVYQCGSPAVVYDKADGKFKMWFTEYNFDTYEKTVWYVESNDGINWDFSQKVQVSYNKPYYNGQYYDVWHLAVHKVGNEFWMIGACNPEGVEDGGAPIHLFLARSNDGINWTFYDTPILATQDSLATDRLYRADFVVKDGTIKVLYSYRNSDGTWHIAYTSQDISNIVDPSVTSDNVITETPTEATTVQVTNEDAYHGNYSCKFVVVANSSEGEKYVGIKQSQDLTGFNKVKFALKITELTGHCAFEVWAGNSKLAEYTSTTSDWEEKEVDVSGISGTQEVKFIARAKDYAEDRKIVAYLDKVVKST